MAIDNDNHYWLMFNCFRRLTPRCQEKLRQRFGSIKAASEASISSLQAAGLSGGQASELDNFRRSFDSDKILAKLDEEGIRLVSILDHDYPALIREIYGYPPLLYYRGSLDNDANANLAIVGTRYPSAYGSTVLPELVSSLAGLPLTVVSGLAIGMDAVAHQSALDNNLKTWAFIGSGLDWDSLYPRDNFKLAERIIASGGAIFSEFPLCSRPDPVNFPKRNRLISGSSKAVLVVEAAMRSGALITARCALEQGRDVLALPGDLGRLQSSGTNHLLQQGAQLISCQDDLRLMFNDNDKYRSQIDKITTLSGHYAEPTISKEMKQIWEALADSKLTANEIAMSCKLDIKSTNSTLGVMEITGKVGVENGYYRRLALIL
jgi:DNA processing protein